MAGRPKRLKLLTDEEKREKKKELNVKANANASLQRMNEGHTFNTRIRLQGHLWQI